MISIEIKIEKNEINAFFPSTKKIPISEMKERKVAK